jgi:hypothetical protein
MARGFASRPVSPDLDSGRIARVFPGWSSDLRHDRKWHRNAMDLAHASAAA